MRFGIGMNTDHTLEEVGQQFEVTRERIRQIEAKALRKLKHPSRSRKMRSFLDCVSRKTPADLEWAAGESEQQLPFADLRDLFPDAMSSRGEPTLPELHRHVRQYADGQQLVIVVDDVQWADAATTRYLSYLARRISTLPWLLVLGLRMADGSLLREDILARLVADPGTTRLPVPELDADGVAAMADAIIGHRVDPGFAAACWTATGGNPSLVSALIGDLARDGMGGDSPIDADRVAATRLDDVVVAVDRRLRRCPPRARALAQAVALLGPRADLHRAATLAGVDPDTAVTLLEHLTAEDLLSDTAPVTVRHPVLRAALLQTLTPGARARGHSAAAQLFLAHGLDDDALAHLLPAEGHGDPAIVDVLRRAGAVALRRGVPEQASKYLARALAEPPPVSLRAEVEYELGLAQTYLGSPEANVHLQAALERSDDPALVAEIALLIGGSQIWAGRWSESRQALERALAVTDDESMREALEIPIVLAATGSARIRRASSDAVRRLRAADVEGSPALAAVLAVELLMTEGPATRVAELSWAALADPRFRAAATFTGLPEMTAAVLGLAGDYVAAIGALDVAVDDARRRRYAPADSRARVLRGFVHQRFGRPHAAEADARAALAMADADVFNATQRPAAIAVLVEALLDTAGPDAARAAVTELLAAPQRDIDSAAAQHLTLALARLALAERTPQQALDLLGDVAEWEAAFGSSVAFAPWRPLAVAANLMLHRRKDALGLSDELTAQAAAFGSVTVTASALHMRGLARREVPALTEAVALLASADSPIEHAFALLDLGRLLRAGRRVTDARDRFREAAAVADLARAVAVADAARRELRASGGRVREASALPAGLTPAELRTARLAADGWSNQDIADAHFLSHRTVEMHLTSVYRKLGIRGRRELAGALPDGPSEGPSRPGPNAVPPAPQRGWETVL